MTRLKDVLESLAARRKMYQKARVVDMTSIPSIAYWAWMVEASITGMKVRHNALCDKTSGGMARAVGKRTSGM